MRTFPRALRDKLEDFFQIVTLEEIARFESKDGTVKFLFGLHDNHAIETVIMRHNYGNSVCVTTQVGCRIGCTFCASTLGGTEAQPDCQARSSLRWSTAQKMLDPTGERVSSIVIMGIRRAVREL